MVGSVSDSDDSILELDLDALEAAATGQDLAAPRASNEATQAGGGGEGVRKASASSPATRKKRGRQGSRLQPERAGGDIDCCIVDAVAGASMHASKSSRENAPAKAARTSISRRGAESIREGRALGEWTLYGKLERMDTNFHSAGPSRGCGVTGASDDEIEILGEEGTFVRCVVMRVCGCGVW